MPAEKQYQVVANEDEQFSIWSAALERPDGWRPAGVTGDKRSCLNFIERVWTDMRPSGLRAG